MGRDPEPAGGFTTAQVARLSGLSPTSVRRWVAQGWIRPERGPRGHRFGWQDVVWIRRCTGVRGVRPGRVARLLADGDVRVCGATGALIALDDRGGFEPSSRQSVFLFEAGPAAVRPLVSQSEGWAAFLAARDTGALERAQMLLQRHLEAFPSHADAWVECGRLHHVQGTLDAAVVAFRNALAQVENAQTWFCLGLVHEDRGCDVAARDAYAEAVALESDFSDAHFNAARVCERLGDRLRALRHLHAYRRTRR